jgi:cyclic pyranopterin phosphate synthase
MPPEGIELKDKEEILGFEEISRLVGLLAEMGVEKVRITGGEPLVRKGVETLISQIRSIRGIKEVCLTTNGVLLKEKLPALKDAGISRINVSLDTLKPERFRSIALRDRYDDVLAGIEEAIRLGFAPLKLNVVVIRGMNDDELLDFVEFVKERPIQVRFIEYMPVGDNGWDRSAFVPCSEMRRVIEERHRLIPISSVAHSTSEDFRIDGFLGTIGFIAPISNPFCSSCNRLRLTADGSLRTCLLNPFSLSLRDLLRNGMGDEEMKEAIAEFLNGKHWQHPPIEELLYLKDRRMAEIGG